MVIAWLPGALAMILVYFLAESVLKGLPAAVLEIPVNAVQALLGAVVGIPVYVTVRANYPRVDQLGQRRAWSE